MAILWQLFWRIDPFLDNKSQVNITAEHWLFIPSVLILGWVIGFLMGQSASRGVDDQK